MGRGKHLSKEERDKIISSYPTGYLKIPTRAIYKIRLG